MHKLMLTGNLNIQVINEIRERHESDMDKWLSGGLEIDASGVEQIDTAGLQYLLMLQRSLQQEGHSLLIKRNGIIDTAAQRLGLQETLFGG